MWIFPEANGATIVQGVQFRCAYTGEVIVEVRLPEDAHARDALIKDYSENLGVGMPIISDNGISDNLIFQHTDGGKIIVGDDWYCDDTFEPFAGFSDEVMDCVIFTMASKEDIAMRLEIIARAPDVTLSLDRD